MIKPWEARRDELIAAGEDPDYIFDTVLMETEIAELRTDRSARIDAAADRAIEALGLCAQIAVQRAVMVQALDVIGDTVNVDSPHYENQLNAITALQGVLK